MPKRAPRGNILLLALLMLAGGIVGGLTVATLVVADLRQARAIDNGLMAYTQAESGLEQSLYDVRQADYCNQAGGNCQDTAYRGCGLPIGTSASNLDCNRKIGPANVVQLPYLEVDQNFQLDFTTPPTSVDFTITWNRDLRYPILPVLEISFLESYTSGGQTSLRVYRQQLGQPYGCTVANITTDTVCQPIPSLSPLHFPEAAESGLNPSLYQVRFRALRAPIVGLQVTPSTLNTAGYLDVWSRGTQGSTTQTLQTTIPRRAPAYGFSDYVIFSEQDIVK